MLNHSPVVLSFKEVISLSETDRVRFLRLELVAVGFVVGYGGINT